MLTKTFFNPFSNENPDPAPGGGGGSPINSPNPAGGAAGGEATADPFQLGENWWEKLPDDIKDEPSIRNYRDVPNLAKALVHAKRAVGAEKIAVPSKHATEDDWKAVFHKLGLPAKPEEYKVDIPDSIPDKEFTQEVLKDFHKAGVLPKQAKMILDAYGERAKLLVQKHQEQQQIEVKKGIESLKQEWGAAFDVNVQKASKALKMYGDDKMAEFMDKTGLGNHPMILKLFSKIGETLGEDNIHGSSSGKTPLTPENAKKEIANIQGNQEHPYHIKNHPGHEAAVQEMHELFKMAYSSGDMQ